MNENYKLEQGNIIYSINEDQKTVSVIGYHNLGCITIPKSIKYESKEYVVTSILQKAFESSWIDSIEFPLDSELQVIEANAFKNSLIKSISIPSSLTELKDGWCSSTKHLKNVAVSPNNPRYKAINGNKMIIGKSSIDQDNYECLVFCARDIKTVTIPSFIEHICRSAFEECRNLEELGIPSDSKLKSIGKKALSLTSIESITIPSQLVDLCEGWCKYTEKLTTINLSSNNPRYKAINGNKMIIGKSSIDQDNYNCLVFCARDIETVTIPSFIQHICEAALHQCAEIKQLEFEDVLNLKTIGKYAFSESSINSFTIPPQITVINKETFYSCEQLQEVEILDDSKLQTIERDAFSCTSIESFKVPSQLIKIGNSSFSSCLQLKEFEIPDDSQLQIIENDAFNESIIESLSIPSHLIDLGQRWCACTLELFEIRISPENPRYKTIDNDRMIIGKSSIEKEKFDCLIFGVRDIDTVTIPSYIENICPFAFSGCINLHNVEFQKDSNLQNFGKFAFSSTSIKYIQIPSKITLIRKHTFHCCHCIRTVNFQDDSNLQSIEEGAFSLSSITCLKIPSKVTKIDNSAFFQCNNLQIIEIDDHTKMEVFDITPLDNLTKVRLMVPVNLRGHFMFGSSKEYLL